MSTSIKILESPSGIGKVCKGDKELARVSYCLEVSQEIIEKMAQDGQSATSSMKIITGQFKIIEGTYMAIDGAVLTLHLEDGRKWQFFFHRLNKLGIYSAITAPEGAAAF
jgi:hypothetical protein